MQIFYVVYDDQAEAHATILQMRRHGNNEEGKGAAQKGFETRGCKYFMWTMMTKLKHVQQSAADLTIPTE